MDTADLTIQLPESEISFLKNYADHQGVTISELIKRYVRNLQKSHKNMIHPDILKITGIVPKDIDIRDEIIEHIREKHS